MKAVARSSRRVPSLHVMRHRLKTVLRVVGIVLGLAVVVVGVKWTGVGAIRAALSRVGVNIGWMFAAYAAGTAVAAVPWRRLFPRHERPSWGATLTSRFAASGLNALVPFFGLGEAARLLWLPRGERSPGWRRWSSIGCCSSPPGRPSCCVAALAATRVPAVPRSYELVALISAAVIMAAVAAVAAVPRTADWSASCAGRCSCSASRRLRPPPPATPAPPATRAPPPRPPIAPTRSTAGCADHHRTARAHPGGFALHLLARLLLAAEIFAGLHILGAHVGPMETLIFIGIPIGLSVVGTFVPGQIGLQEGASALVAAALGIGPATGIALVFLQRLRQLVFVPLAGLLIALVPYGPRTSDP